MSSRVPRRGCSRSWRRWPRSPRSAGSRSRRSRTSSRRPTSCCSPATRSAARRLRGRGRRGARQQRVLRPGPWTPWQMCAWGGVGVAGALLARGFGRELGRVGLAVACAAAGAAYGVVMNLHLGHVLRRPQPGQARRLLRDVAAVRPRPRRRQRAVLPALGPALVRALDPLPRSASRSPGGPRRRSRPRCSPRSCSPPPRRAPLTGGHAARGWLGAANRDGGFGGDRGQRSTGLYTSWAALGLAAAGRNPRDVRRGGEDVVAYVRAHRRAAAPTSADTTRTILLSARPACRRDRRPRPRATSCSRRGPAARSPTASTRPRSRSSRCAPRGAHDRAVARRRALDRARGQRDGGFNFAGKGAASGIDDTGAALQALVAAGRRGHPDRPPCRALPRPPAEPRRRLPAPARRRLQRAVDRVGGPGARRRRPQPRSPAAQRREVPGRLPALAGERERQGPLLAHERPDAGVGHRPGARGARPQAVPARRRCRARGARAPRDPRRRADGDAEPRSPAERRPSRGQARYALPRTRPRRPPTPRIWLAVQSAARAAGYLAGALVGPIA